MFGSFKTSWDENVLACEEGAVQYSYTCYDLINRGEVLSCGDLGFNFVVNRFLILLLCVKFVSYVGMVSYCIYVEYVNGKIFACRLGNLLGPTCSINCHCRKGTFTLRNVGYSIVYTKIPFLTTETVHIEKVRKKGLACTTQIYKVGIQDGPVRMAYWPAHDAFLAKFMSLPVPWTSDSSQFLQWFHEIFASSDTSLLKRHLRWIKVQSR